MHTLTVLNFDKEFVLVLFGGRSAVSDSMDDLWIFSSRDSSWRNVTENGDGGSGGSGGSGGGAAAAAAMAGPSKRWGHMQQRLTATSLLVYGGLSGGTPFGSVLDDLWRLDVAVDVDYNGTLNHHRYKKLWSLIATLPSPLFTPPGRGLGTLAVFNESTIVVTGGWDGQSMYSRNDTYLGTLSSQSIFLNNSNNNNNNNDTVYNYTVQWQYLGANGPAVSSAGSVVKDGCLMVFLGINNLGPLITVRVD